MAGTVLRSTELSRVEWFKFRSLASFLTTKNVSLLLRGKVYEVYDACVRSCMLHGRETWSLKRENELPLHWAERKMVRWMFGVKVRDKLPGIELRQQLGIEDIVKVVHRNRM